MDSRIHGCSGYWVSAPKSTIKWQHCAIIIDCSNICRVLLLRNFGLQHIMIIHHRNVSQHPPFAIENLSFRPSTDNVSIDVRAKNQRIIFYMLESSTATKFCAPRIWSCDNTTQNEHMKITSLILSPSVWLMSMHGKLCFSWSQTNATIWMVVAWNTSNVYPYNNQPAQWSETSIYIMQINPCILWIVIVNNHTFPFYLHYSYLGERERAQKEEYHTGIVVISFLSLSEFYHILSLLLFYAIFSTSYIPWVIGLL